MAAEDINIGEKLTSFPIGELIYTVAMGIAKAQWELNKSSMVSAELMSGSRILRDLHTGNPVPDATGGYKYDDTRVFFGYDYTFKDDGTFSRDPRKVSLLELGFTPTFYQFTETVIEVYVNISVHKDVSTDRTDKGTSTQSGGNLAVASTVDAAYSQTYNYSAEGSSSVRTKLVPIPPPPILDERIRMVMNAEKQIQDLFDAKTKEFIDRRKALLKLYEEKKNDNIQGPLVTKQLEANQAALTKLQTSAAAEKVVPVKVVIPDDTTLKTQLGVTS